jgi:hemolysin activation/secretion protein
MRGSGRLNNTRGRRACLVFLVGCALSPLAMAGSETAAQPSESEAFPILEYRVLNNTVLSTRQIESAVYPHLGPNRTLNDVQAARTDLEKAYHDAGYSSVFVDIPEQSVDRGVVRLGVTEGRLSKIQVQGARYFMNRRILAAVPSLQPGVVPHFPDVQREMTKLNQTSPDLQVAPILKPGPDPGTVDVELKVKDKLPLHASAEVNNNYTAYTTHARVNLNVSYANLFQRQQTLSLQYQTAPANSSDERVLAATYLVPLARSGNTLAFFAVDTNSDVATVGTLGVIGAGHVYGTRYIVPLHSGDKFYPSLTFGADLKLFNESVLVSAGPGLQTPIKYMNWSVAYGANLLAGASSITFNFANNFGIRGIFNTPEEFENKRAFAKPNYVYWHADTTFERPLPLGMRLALRIAGQYTTEPLISNEQFAIGGVNSVRGYLEAEDLGDVGVNGSIELRSPNITNIFGGHPKEAYVYVFYDAAVASLNDPLPSQVARYDLQGFGLGFRIADFGGFDAGLDVANPRITTPFETTNDPRIHFHFRYVY